MKVVCENCRAVYKVPDEKLTKTVNKATCRQCGHRMLIPKARPDGDPDERTLVTAVPPPGTPSPAIPRALDGERVTAAIDDEPEETHAGRGPDDVELAAVPTTATPLAADEREVVPAQSAAAEPPRLSNPVPETVAAREAKKTPLVAPPRPRTPAPAPVQMGPLGHDPSADLNWAILGAVGALIGAILLSFLSILNNSWVMWGGLALAFGGSVLTLGVLFSGNRGRQAASPLGSVAAAGIVGILAAGALVSTKIVALQVFDAGDISFDNLDLSRIVVPSPQPVPPTPAPTEPAVAVADVAEGVTGEAAVAEPAPPPAPVAAVPQVVPPPLPVPVAAPVPAAPRPAPSPSPSPRPSPSPSPRPVPPPAPAPQPIAPAPVAPSAPAAMATVPVEVIHVMLSSNVAVKRCFVPLLKAGALPPRVDVRFTLSSAGKASGVGVTQSEYVGSDLERCLAAAVAGIAFPPTTGSGQNIVYPFVLK